MSERQMLEIGTRAIGVIFLCRALIASSTILGSFYLLMARPDASLLVAVVELIAAFAVVRYAEPIAARIAEPFNAVEENACSCINLNRWLIASAAVCVVTSSFIGGIFGQAKSGIFGLYRYEGAPEYLTALALFCAVELAVITYVLGAIVNQRSWLFGERYREK